MLFFSSEFERKEYIRYLAKVEKIADCDLGEVSFPHAFVNEVLWNYDIEDLKKIKSSTPMQAAFVKQYMSAFRAYLK